MDNLRKVQEIAPTEIAGRGHAAVRTLLAAEKDLGRITVSTVSGECLGEVELQGALPARLIVMDDGIGLSGSTVYSPAILITRE
ncbi:MAG TPA: hypothetical protein VFI84_00900 [Candidatus Saccharimonadales bacterium]|nr:hypothetical protein [Candidatus Saccharimonadales bacterium]